jgi:hypothetical protein
MDIVRTYAFQVTPLRTVSVSASPQGGLFQASDELRALFNDLVKTSKLEIKSLVDLLSDDDENSPYRSSIRDRLSSVCFGDEAEAATSATEVAAKLSLSMDNRSAKQSLFVLVTYGDEKTRRAVMWLFPKEDVFRFDAGKRQPDLKLLTDVFSKSSTWRKAALFSGTSTKNGFRTGRVIDNQSGKSDETAADFWIHLFLNARYAMDSKNATNQLVGYLKDAFQSSVGHQREQLYSAITGIPLLPDRDWTFKEVAEQYLDKEYRSGFLSLVPVELRESSFKIDSGVFESKLNTRVFETVEGVWLSAPLSEIGSSVKVVDDRNQITFKGTIKAEEMRARHVK